MNTKDYIKLLEEWKRSYELMESSFDDMAVLMGCSICESDIFKYSFHMFEEYNKTLAIVLNGGNENAEDIQGWLEWYCYECKMGQKAMEAKASGWNKSRVIKTVKDLLNIIEAK